MPKNNEIEISWYLKLILYIEFKLNSLIKV